MRVNGVRLYYEEHGAGEAILCIHGTGSSAAAWAGAVEELARRGRTIAYDRRGSSRSERPEPYATDVHEQADDAAALIEALAAAPALVIGRSYGVDTALDLALRYPDRVRALALLEGAELVTEAGRRWLADLTERVLAAADSGAEAVAETLLRSVLGGAGWEGLGEPARQMFAANGPAIVAELRGGLLDVGIAELRTVTQPTLLVTGEDSVPVYAEVVDVMSAAMPSARVARVGGGHIIDPAHPVVLAFVDEVLAGA